MGSATVKVVLCGSTCARGNALTSRMLNVLRKDLPPMATVIGDQGYDNPGSG